MKRISISSILQAALVMAAPGLLLVSMVLTVEPQSGAALALFTSPVQTPAAAFVSPLSTPLPAQVASSGEFALPIPHGVEQKWLAIASTGSMLRYPPGWEACPYGSQSGIRGGAFIQLLWIDKGGIAAQIEASEFVNEASGAASMDAEYSYWRQQGKQHDYLVEAVTIQGHPGWWIHIAKPLKGTGLAAILWADWGERVYHFQLHCRSEMCAESERQLRQVLSTLKVTTVDWKPAPGPLPAPSDRSSVSSTEIALVKTYLSATRTYTAYLPLVSKSLGMGLAANQYHYSTQLKADWYYVYGWCEESQGCTPMSPLFDPPPAGKSCPNTMLLGNEPELPGYNHIDAGPAATKSRTLRNVCPNTLFIVGNTANVNATWLDQYVAAGGVHDGKTFFGTHCYAFHSASLDWCKVTLTSFRDHFVPTPIAVTEWNIPIVWEASDKFPDWRRNLFRDYMHWLEGFVMVSVVYTDYCAKSWGWCSGHDLNLTDIYGNPNPLGIIYANERTPYP